MCIEILLQNTLNFAIWWQSCFVILWFGIPPYRCIRSFSLMPAKYLATEFNLQVASTWFTWSLSPTEVGILMVIWNKFYISLFHFNICSLKKKWVNRWTADEWLSLSQGFTQQVDHNNTHILLCLSFYLFISLT